MNVYTFELHNDTTSKLIHIRASSLENGLYAAQWLHKGKLISVPVDLCEYEEVC